MTTAQKNKAELDAVIINIIERVETAGSWVKPFKTGIMGGLPTSASTGKGYNGINIFNLWAIAEDRGYKSSKWATYKQIKAAGNTVNKGEKASTVYFFKPIKINEEQDDGSTEEKTIPYLKRYNVFNLDQTRDGDPDAVEPEIIDPIEIIQNAEEFYSNLDYLEIRAGGQPCYIPSLDIIKIPSIQTFISAEAYYSTLGHEYIHSTGHETRLNRPQFSPKQDREAYAFEELIAELGSVLLMAHLNIEAEPVQDNSAAYLKSWLKGLKDDPKQLWKAASAASKAAERLKEAAAKRAKEKEEKAA